MFLHFWFLCRISKLFIFIEIGPKIKLFAKTYKILGVPAAELSSLRPPNTAPPLQISGYTAYCKRVPLRFQVL